MRQSREEQLSILPSWGNNNRAKELEVISKILDASPEVFELALLDLGGKRRTDLGRTGMSAEQVVRVGVLKSLWGCTYRALAFHLEDSSACRTFARLDFDRNYSHSTLQENIKKLSEDTLEKISACLIKLAQVLGIEDGQQIRGDCTVTETNIHEPSDSRLLYDTVRVVARNLLEFSLAFPMIELPFADHRRKARRRMLEIQSAKSADARLEHYQDLLETAEATHGYGTHALQMLKVSELEALDVSDLLQLMAMEQELGEVLPLMRKAIDQTYRRVINGEKVPANEKIVSIFEPHTDIIIKDRRQVFFGHKLCLVSGKSNLITDVVIEQGNPADSTLVARTIIRHREIFNSAPRQCAFDGGFTSKANVKEAHELGVVDIAFHKKRGISIADMVSKPGTFKKLRNFRAGIEAGISLLKRCFGLTRCNWKGFPGFKRYIRFNVFSHNLVVMARHLIATGLI